MEIEFTPDGKRMLLIVHREGRAPHRDRFDPVSAKARKAVAKAWGVDEEKVTAWCEETRIAGSSRKFTVHEDKPDTGAIVVRGLDQKREEGTSYDVGPQAFLRDVLPGVPVASVAEWKGAEALVCLDVDYHDTTPPNRDWLETLILTRLSPSPIAWHFSKSGGLHLFYIAAGSFTADELAACAALRFRSIDRAAGLELKCVVRGPGADVVRHATYQDAGAGLIEWLGTPEFDETERDAWLEREGMECGRRYEHDKCPIDPGPGAERQPVVVSETGVYCFRCNGKGLSFGSRRPGYASWPALLGSPSSGELGGLVRNMVHWGHAKYVLTERYGFPEPLARLAYRAALKAYHVKPDDAARLPGVFNPRIDELARVNNLWMTIPTSYTYPKDIQNLIACMPAAPDAAAVCELNQGKDLSTRGYKNIAVVHGFRMASVFLPDPGQTTVAVPNPELRDASTRCLPKYVAKSRRMNLDDAWGEIERIVPRIDRQFVRMNLLAFGCAQETRAGLLPIIFASGPSGVGKTAMVQIAAGILGARIGTEATFNEDSAKFRQDIFTGGQQGPVVVLNELIKDSTRGRRKLTIREALDFVLNLTPYSSSWVSYRGPVKMGRLPALVITETNCPAAMQEETQIARRIRHHYIGGKKVEWIKTISAAGLSDLNLIRTASDATARACDAILSDIIDTCFSTPGPWDEKADELGLHTIEKSDDFEDATPWLRELFRQVCLAKPLPERERKLYADGYKKVQRNDGPGEDSELCKVYTKFADATGGPHWATSRRLLEKDWGFVLGVDRRVELDIRGGADTIYLRFRSGPMKKPEAVNEQIINAKTWESIL